MALKVPELSTIPLLDALQANYLDTCVLRLYSNNHTPTDADVVGDYTECTFPGYAPINMNVWTSAVLNADDKAEIEEPIQTFTAGAIVTPQDVYGIYVTDAGGDLVYAELNPAGVVVMSVAGQTYSYLPRVTLASEF